MVGERGERAAGNGRPQLHNDPSMDASTHKQHIGALCQRIRLQVKEWSLYQAEKASGLQGSQIKAIEAGDKDYTIDTLVKYCSALGITIDLKYEAR